MISSPRFSHWRVAPWVLYTALIITPVATHAAESFFTISGTVPADCPARQPVLVSVPCPTAPRAGAMLSVAVHVKPGSNTPLPAQYEPADDAAGTPARLWFTLVMPEEARGQPIRVALLTGPSDKESTHTDAYRSQQEGAQLHITTRDGPPVLSYWHGQPAKDQRLPLTDFIHPVFGLDGEVLTAKSPSDHIWHRGVFWAWVRHERNGESLGTWWIPDTIRLAPGDLTTADGPVFSRFSAQHDWVYQPKGSTEGKPFMREQVVCRVFQAAHGGRAIDLDITLTALDEGLRLGGTLEQNKGYGGLTFRYGPVTSPGAPKKPDDPSAVQVVVDGKRVEKDVIQGKAKWADWSAVFKMPDGTPAKGRSGAAVFVSTAHPEYPPEWLTRFYGVLNVSYPGLKMLDMPKDKPLRLPYRVWVHRGDAKDGAVEEQYRAYIADWKWKTPPQAADGEQER